MRRSDWRPTVEKMLAELRSGGPREEAFWAQQLAFGPVLVHAVGLQVRRGGLVAPELIPCLRLAHAALGSLPEPPAADAVGLQMLAARQARALGWRRRATLSNLLTDLGAPRVDGPGAAPPRMARCYPLIGFRPDERLAG